MISAKPVFVPCWSVLMPSKFLDRGHSIAIALSLIGPELIRHASAAPVAVEPPWVPEPTGRGTIGLVLPCVITLGLCVWTAVNLNAVTQPSTGWPLAMKAAWTFLGMFTPDLVLIPFKQYLDARSVRYTLDPFATKKTLSWFGRSSA